MSFMQRLEIVDRERGTVPPPVSPPGVDLYSQSSDVHRTVCAILFKCAPTIHSKTHSSMTFPASRLHWLVGFNGPN